MCQGAVANEAKYDDVSTAAVGDDSEMLAGCGPLSPEAVYNVSISRLLSRDWCGSTLTVILMTVASNFIIPELVMRWSSSFLMCRSSG